MGCLCADVEQFRADEGDDVLEDRRRHCGGFRINRDNRLLAELAVVIFLRQRVTGSDPLLNSDVLCIALSESKIVDRGLIDDILVPRSLNFSTRISKSGTLADSIVKQSQCRLLERVLILSGRTIFLPR